VVLIVGVAVQARFPEPVTVNFSQISLCGGSRKQLACCPEEFTGSVGLENVAELHKGIA
jgi:hypothetical protein